MPASSREMSSSATNRLSSASTEPSRCCTRRLASSSMLRPRRAPTNMPSACTGWRRSWLAAARKRDLATLACSAISFWRCRSSTRSRFSKRRRNDAIRLALKRCASSRNTRGEDNAHQRQRMVQRVATRGAPQHEGQQRRHGVGVGGGQVAAEGRHRARRGGRDEQHDHQLRGGVGCHQPDGTGAPHQPAQQCRGGEAPRPEAPIGQRRRAAAKHAGTGPGAPRSRPRPVPSKAPRPLASGPRCRSARHTAPVHR